MNVRELTTRVGILQCEHDRRAKWATQSIGDLQDDFRTLADRSPLADRAPEPRGDRGSIIRNPDDPQDWRAAVEENNRRVQDLTCRVYRQARDYGTVVEKLYWPVIKDMLFRLFFWVLLLDRKPCFFACAFFVKTIRFSEVFFCRKSWGGRGRGGRGGRILGCALTPRWLELDLRCCMAKRTPKKKVKREGAGSAWAETCRRGT